MKIDLHTHILPRDWPDLHAKYGYGGFVRLDHYKPCCARMMVGDRLFRGTSSGFALGLIALLVLMVVVLATQSERVFSQLGFHFVTGRSWAPNFNRFGALPLIFGTLVTSAIAIVLAVPVSVGLAVLLNESHSGVIRNGLAVFVDLLAAVPSVVYGLWGIFVMAPVFDHHVEPFLTSTIGRSRMMPNELTTGVSIGARKTHARTDLIVNADGSMRTVLLTACRSSAESRSVMSDHGNQMGIDLIQ